MSRRDKLKGIFDGTAEELAMANFDEEREASRGPAGPVRSMALTLGKMEEEARAMHDALVAGLHVQELETDVIDDSFVRDRIGEIELSENDPFVRSIADNGQEVPILVRPHPGKRGRYQVAYGHRRLRAARLLKLRVRAIIKEIADDELVIAQGIENTARADLSYIEKAMFAHTLEGRGFKRAVIMQALHTDKTELSKMISVAQSVAPEVVDAIGAAPGYGRRKWLAFAELCDEMSSSKLEKLFGSADFKLAESDRRFDMAIAELAGPTARPIAITWKPEASGDLSGNIRSDGKTYTLALKAKEAVEFGDFLTRKLDDLYQEFKRQG